MNNTNLNAEKDIQDETTNESPTLSPEERLAHAEAMKEFGKPGGKADQIFEEFRQSLIKDREEEKNYLEELGLR